MSEPFDHGFQDYIDWSNVDLLDSCYDQMPAEAGMDLNSHHERRHVVLPDMGLSPEMLSLGPPIIGAGNSQTEASHHLQDTPDAWEIGAINAPEWQPLPGPTVEQTPSFNNSHQTQTPTHYTGDNEHLASGHFERFSNTKFENFWALERHYIATCHYGRPRCNVCHVKFPTFWHLGRHAKATSHCTYQCSVNGCQEAFMSASELQCHIRTPHIAGHSRIQKDGPNHCIQCGEVFTSKANLLHHSKDQQHQPYGCECGGLFSRIDVLNRHLKSFGTDIPQYPCLYCRRHRGADGFRRADHLVQHIRNYHHHDTEDGSEDATSSTSRLKYILPVCHYTDCPKYRGPEFLQLSLSARGAAKPFRSQSEYTKHMKDEHNECLFPCDVSGCDRVGRRGYFREKDMMRHRMDRHPEASPYQVSERKSRVACPESGCGAILHHSSLKYHIMDKHYEEYRKMRFGYGYSHGPTIGQDGANN